MKFKLYLQRESVIFSFSSGFILYFYSGFAVLFRLKYLKFSFPFQLIVLFEKINNTLLDLARIYFIFRKKIEKKTLILSDSSRFHPQFFPTLARQSRALFG